MSLVNKSRNNHAVPNLTATTAQDFQKNFSLLPQLKGADASFATKYQVRENGSSLR